MDIGRLSRLPARCRLNANHEADGESKCVLRALTQGFREIISLGCTIVGGQTQYLEGVE